MKAISTILALSILSINALGTPVPAQKLHVYKEGVKLALKDTNLTCTFTPKEDHWTSGEANSDALVGLINQAQSADVDESGAQPVLTFHYQTTTDEAYGQVQTISVTTSSDYKSIVEIDFSQVNVDRKEINLGNILDPQLGTQIVQSNPISASCK